MHVVPFEAFFAVCGQWRVAPMGMAPSRYLGLDYAAVAKGFELADITVTPAEWADFRTIEAGAAMELNRE